MDRTLVISVLLNLTCERDFLTCDQIGVLISVLLKCGFLTQL